MLGWFYLISTDICHQILTLFGQQILHLALVLPKNKHFLSCRYLFGCELWLTTIFLVHSTFNRLNQMSLIPTTGIDRGQRSADASCRLLTTIGCMDLLAISPCNHFMTTSGSWVDCMNNQSSSDIAVLTWPTSVSRHPATHLFVHESCTGRASRDVICVIARPPFNIYIWCEAASALSDVSPHHPSQIQIAENCIGRRHMVSKLTHML